MHDLSLNKGLCKAIYNAKYACVDQIMVNSGRAQIFKF